jgi:hypothetical protein
LPDARRSLRHPSEGWDPAVNRGVGESASVATRTMRRETGDTTPQVARHRSRSRRRRWHPRILGTPARSVNQPNHIPLDAHPLSCPSCPSMFLTRIDTSQPTLVERAVRVDAGTHTKRLDGTALCILLQGRRLSLDNSIPAMPRSTLRLRRHREITDHPALGESAKPKTTAPQGG